MLFPAGQGGIGKSTAMKHLALTWADGKDGMKQFDFFFHVALKSVRDHRSIEDIILQQHAALIGNGVISSEIKAILDDPEQRVLLILDGHDEYKPGTNRDIDAAIRKKRLRHCWIVVTSRENKDLPSLRDYIDAEAELMGFDKARVEEYITKYLGHKGKCQELMKIAKKYGLIKSDWEEIRKSGKKTKKDIESILVKLGKFVLLKLQEYNGSQIFQKVKTLA